MMGEAQFATRVIAGPSFSGGALLSLPGSAINPPSGTLGNTTETHEISHMHLHANAHGPHAGADFALFAPYITRSRFIALYITDARKAGIYLGYGWINDVLHCMFDGNGIGLQLVEAVNNVNVLNSVFEGNYGPAIVVDGGMQVRIEGNVMESNRGPAVIASGSTALTVHSNYYEANNLEYAWSMQWAQLNWDANGRNVSTAAVCADLLLNGAPYHFGEVQGQAHRMLSTLAPCEGVTYTANFHGPTAGGCQNYAAVHAVAVSGLHISGNGAYAHCGTNASAPGVVNGSDQQFLRGLPCTATAQKGATIPPIALLSTGSNASRYWVRDVTFFANTAGFDLMSLNAGPKSYQGTVHGFGRWVALRGEDDEVGSGGGEAALYTFHSTDVLAVNFAAASYPPHWTALPGMAKPSIAQAARRYNGRQTFSWKWDGENEAAAALVELPLADNPALAGEAVYVALQVRSPNASVAMAIDPGDGVFLKPRCSPASPPADSKCWHAQPQGRLAPGTSTGWELRSFQATLAWHGTARFAMHASSSEGGAVEIEIAPPVVVGLVGAGWNSLAGQTEPPPTRDAPPPSLKTDDMPTTAGTRVTPQPQRFEQRGFTVDLRGWAIASSNKSADLAVEQLAAATGGALAGSVASLPAGKPFVAMGLPSEDKALAALAAKRKLWNGHLKSGDEGYVLDVSKGSVLLLGSDAAGVFWGVQSLKQLLGKGTSVGGCHVVDWPDFPIRGAYMFGAPRIDRPALGNAALEWDKKLVDWMATHKMNFGVVVSSFYEIRAALDSNKSEALSIRSQLQELQQYMKERFIEFVPTLGSGSGGGPEFFRPVTAEGKWVRNASFQFGDDDVAAAAAAGASLNGSQALNGDFASLGADGLPSDWRFAAGAKGVVQWSVDESTAPWSSRSGRSLHCKMETISCTTMPPDGQCSSQQAISPRINVTGGWVVQISIWAKLANLTGSNSRGPQITAVPVDAPDNAGSVASINLDSKPLVGPKGNYVPSSAWYQYTLAITLPANATQLYLYSRLQGPNQTAEWWLADIDVVALDTTLRNIIRTNVTDIEVRGAGEDSDKVYALDKDFSIENPKTEDTTDRLNVSFLEPYTVHRKAGGGIAAGARVRLSYDYLPGKVDTQGHSTPNAFCEPEYYDFMDDAIRTVSDAFPGVRYINFNHDEIRGMARDSRSLRSGLSNAELLAKDMNTLQASVETHVGSHGRALFWDDMVNPDHNGGQFEYQWQTGGGRPGKTDAALLDELISHNVLWFSWAYGVTPDTPTAKFSDLRKIKHAPQLFGSTSYDWVGSPWRTPANVAAWGRALLEARDANATQGHGRALGLVDTEWGSQLPAQHFGDIPDVAACAWNVAGYLNSSL